jgi:hypothetical protein
MALSAVRFISVLPTFSEMCLHRINSLPRQQWQSLGFSPSLQLERTVQERRFPCRCPAAQLQHSAA